MNHVTQPLTSADISIFFTGNQQVLLYQEIQIYIAFSESLNVFLINLIIILMISAKMGSPGLLKITIF